MHSSNRVWRALLLGTGLLLAATGTLLAKKKETGTPVVLWRDPGDIASRDVRYGPGGPDRLPQGRLRFLAEESGGAEPKFDVEDEQGVRWRVKPGREAKSETAATRLLWAVGYLVDEDYYLPQARVEGMEKLSRGQEYVSPDGTVRDARWERRDGPKKLSPWSWSKNPFLGTRELDGLRVMMALMNNWDLKDLNNAIYEKGGERHYLVSDVGATFGRSGNTLTRTKSNLEHYRESKFIRKTSSKHVDFVLASDSHPLNLLIFPHLIELKNRETVVKRVPREHARWIGQLLAQLSEEQLRDCFRSAGYSPDEVEGFTAVVQERIRALNEL